MLGALVKFSWMYWKVPAERRKLSMELSRPFWLSRS